LHKPLDALKPVIKPIDLSRLEIANVYFSVFHFAIAIFSTKINKLISFALNSSLILVNLFLGV